ncbi:hypothetical protein [Agaribacter flavus]|uniref:Uncharacterized protein n=1 Tax=Agaribacter flavus TaxID=1902781 RepID=A0ABV7FMR0_9ALTE
MESTNFSNTNQVVEKNNVIQLSRHAFKQASKTGWWCNLADRLNLAVKHPYVISIKKRRFSQYSLICALLKAGTCEKIFFDCDLSQAQAEYLGKLQRHSRTELIHARLAEQFSMEMA